MCDTWILTVGDGGDYSKDLVRRITKKGPASAPELRALAVQAISASFDEERAIDDGEVDEDNNGLTLIVAEGPHGECAPNAGPWLVARLAIVEEV